MKQFTKFLALGVVIALFSALVLPIAAQEDAPGPGAGGTIVEANLGDDPSTFNPVISNDASSSDVHQWLYPDIIGIDPVTLVEAPNVDQALATGWEYDETGTVLTVHLRQDAYWADGTQITAADYMWVINAVRSGLTSSPRTNVFYELDDGTVTEGFIHEIEALDDFTIQLRLGSAVTDENGELMYDDEGHPMLTVACDAISDLNDIAVVPSHIFEDTFGSDYASMDSDPYFVPRGEGDVAATFGPFTDPFIETGVQVSLLVDETYPDTQLGFVSPGEWLYQNVADQTIMYERFLAGDFTIISVVADKQNETRADERFQIFETPANGYTYMGYNLADPENPLPGKDEEGNLLDQGNHPIFGDLRVRLAIAYGVNVQEMIGTRPDGDNPATGILEGNGYPVASNNSLYFTSNEELEALGVAPYEYDPVRADELLVEAGWTDEDGDGVRECNGCMYAEEGAPLEFELLTNAGNVLRESTGETIRAQLADLGFVVNFQAIEFGSLVDELLNQQFDAIIIGWTGLGTQPGGSLKNFYFAANDIPGGGFNFVSFNDGEFDDLVNLADALPAAEDGSYEACDPDERDRLYAQAQYILYEQQPYLWLYQGSVMVAAQGNVENFDPLPLATQWNIDAWFLSGE